jgi:hypothetical protein
MPVTRGREVSAGIKCKFMSNSCTMYNLYIHVLYNAQVFKGIVCNENDGGSGIW